MKSHYSDFLKLKFLKKVPAKKINPIVCQRLIFANPKIVGINQFHKNIVGNVNTITNMLTIIMVPNTTKNDFKISSFIIY